MKSKTLNSKGSVQLANYLKSQRKALGLSRSKLGTRMGVDHTVIKKIEQHERRLDLVELVRFCRALGISLVDALKIVIDAEASE